MRHFIVSLEDDVDPVCLPNSAVEIAINSMDPVENFVVPMSEVIDCYNLRFPFNCVALNNVYKDLSRYTGEGARRKEWDELSPELKQTFIDCVETDGYYEQDQEYVRCYSVFASDELNYQLDSYFHSLSYHQLPLEI